MFTLAWRGVRFNLGRYLATLVAIMTGVAFFAASGFLSDRIIDALEGDVDRQYGAVDAAVVIDLGDAPVVATDRLRIAGSEAAAIAALPSVEAVAGELVGNVAFMAADGTPFAENAAGRLWIDDAELNPTELIEGAAPQAAGQIAVDRGTAAEHDLAVGDTTTVLTMSGRFPATVVGITRFGNADSADRGGTVSISRADAFDWLNNGEEEYAALFIRGRGGQQTVRAAVAELAPAGFTVQTGDEFRADRRASVGAIGRTLKKALQFFSILALVVGGFVISNTFNVIVAQRLRELAVLAAIGATPRQLKRSLRYEGLVIGLLGSIAGVAAGFGLTFVLMAVLGALGFDLPGSGLRVAPNTVVLAVAFGTIITLLSVAMPARRAGKAEPIEALRQAEAATVSVSKVRTAIAVALVAVGAVAMLGAPDAKVLGVGALVLFVGVILSGPLIAVVGSRLLRPVLRVMGLEGRLAADNTARNPQRTAATSNALLIGVFLVTLVTVAGTSVKDYAVAEIEAVATADFLVFSDGGTVDDALVAEIEAVDGVELVTPFRQEPAALRIGEGRDVPVGLSTGDLDQLVAAAGLVMRDGTFGDLRPGTVLLPESLGADAAVGALATVTDSRGRTVELTVAGVMNATPDAIVTGAIVDRETFDAFVGPTDATFAFVKARSGDQTDTKKAIEAIAALRPDINVQEGNQLGRLVASIFDFLINAVNGLLLMSVVIALIGIVNTLTLSILERRRELGLLRVVGMVDRRVRRMVRAESAVIATLGTVSGLALGTFAGFALLSTVGRLTDSPIALSLPWTLLVVVLVAGIGLGVLAALLPAQRSTRLDVLDALRAG